MVQKYQSPVRIYKYPFELVMAAYELRFPTCDMIPVVRKTTIIDEDVSEDGGVHVIDRRAELVIELPYLLKKFMGIDACLFRQRNTLDRRQRTLKIDAWNESFAARIGIKEFCVYSVHPDNPEWTCFEQSAELDIKAAFGFEATVEKIAISEYSKSIAKSGGIMEYHIDVLAERGITHVPIWTCPVATGDAKGVANAASTAPATAGAADNGSVVVSNASAEHRHGRDVSGVVDAAEESETESGIHLPGHSTDEESNGRSQQDSRTGAAASASCHLERSDTVIHVATVGANASANACTSTISPPSASATLCSQLERHASISDAAAGGASSVNATPVSGSNNSVASQKAKLEQAYIHTYLGELTPIQESRLVQLKQRVAADGRTSSSLPADAVILRFLKARDWNVEKARDMLFQSVVWRKKNGVDKILAEYEMPDVLARYFPGGWHYHDRENRPLYILRLGQTDVKGIIRSVGIDGITRLTLHVCEEGLRRTAAAARRTRQPVTTWTLLLDLDGFNMRHLWRPAVKAVLQVITMCEANYPETLGRLLVVRAPRVFPIMLALVHPWIDETSRAKFVFFSGAGDEHLRPEGEGGLVDYVARECTPHWMGGTCPASGGHHCHSAVGDGGIVPKAFYMPADQFEREQKTHMMFDVGADGASGYQSTSLVRGHVYEALIQITDKGCVITWDFDVLRNDVVFSVLRVDAKHSTSFPTAADASPAMMLRQSNSESPPGCRPNELKAAHRPASRSATHLRVARASNHHQAADHCGESGGSGSAASSSGGSGSGRVGSAVAAASAGTIISGPGFSMVAPGPHGHGAASTSVVLPYWREGVHYWRVEGSIICHEGESIQGSHVTSAVGTYVLQWRLYEGLHDVLHAARLTTVASAATAPPTPTSSVAGGAAVVADASSAASPPAASAATTSGVGVASRESMTGGGPSALDEVIDSLKHQPKAKVMFFYEVLSAADYRGSMSSVRSQSSVSLVSNNSTAASVNTSSGDSSRRGTLLTPRSVNR